MTRHLQFQTSQQNAETAWSGRVPWWLWPNLLALDAPVIAFFWQELLARSVGVSLFLPGRFGLGLAVWIVYLADRLLDAAKPEQSREPARHQFCRNHIRLLSYLLLCVVGAAAAVSIFVRPALALNGLVIAVIVAAYFVLVHLINRSRTLPKELLVSLLFVAGTAVAPWSRTGAHAPLAFAVLAFFAVCTLNTVLIEYNEWRLHVSGNVPHLSTQFIGKYFGGFALIVSVLCATGSALGGGRAVLVCSAFSSALLWIVCALRHQLSPELFRVLADVALLTPAAAIGWRIP